MTAFFLMYRMNNEYTARGEEPIQGILCLDEEKAAGKLHYLVREWQYITAGIFPLENTEEWNWVTKMPLPMAAEPIG